MEVVTDGGNRIRHGKAEVKSDPWDILVGSYPSPYPECSIPGTGGAPRRAYGS